MTTVYCTKGHENQDSNRFCQICGEKLNPPVPATNLAAGNVLEDRYRIVQQIGQGGFGRTYLCENLTRFNEPCVLKEFAPQVQGTYALEKAKKLFEREASVLHNLAHPQIPRFRELFEMKTGSHGLFLVQDYVAGQTYRYLLAARQNQNRLFTEEEIQKLLIDTLPVLQYIHSLGVIHRDIAPDNLMLRSSDNLPVLIDFGGVKQIAVNAEIQATGNTEVPTCLGKVGYAPYEQMQRGAVSANSDLYALAATCLVLLTGKEPTELIDPQSLTWNWRSAINLESNLGKLFDRMLQPNPTARYQSASEVLGALKQQVDNSQQPITQQPAPANKSAIGTVVVAPGGDQKQANINPVSATENSNSFLQILGRSWICILGLGTAGAIAWVGNNIFFNRPTAPTPTPPAVSNSSTPTSIPLTASTPSPNGASSPDGNSPNTSINNNNTGDDSSNTNRVINRPNNGQPSKTNNGAVSGAAQTGERRSSRITNSNSGNSLPNDSPVGERPRRNANNSITPPLKRNNSTVDNKPTFQPPQIEEFDTKRRAPKVAAEEKRASKPPQAEESEKPRTAKVATEEKPISQPPPVEKLEKSPRQSTSTPESATKPDKSDKEPVKKE
jgi:serine/threonine protein kinase, bacterial